MCVCVCVCVCVYVYIVIHRNSFVESLHFSVARQARCNELGSKYG